MRNYLMAYYGLFLLFVMGAFASMALNSYGVVLMSYAALGFGLSFLYELIFWLPRQEGITSSGRLMLVAELVMLELLCVLYFLEGVNVIVPGLALLRMLSLVVLLFISVYHLIYSYLRRNKTAIGLKVGIALYYLTLSLFLFAGLMPSYLSYPVVILAFMVLALFILYNRWRSKIIVEGEETTVLATLMKFRNKSGLQLVALVLISAYSTLAYFQWLPPLYSGALPNGYRNVVRQWETRQQNPDRRVTDPEAFEKAYREFIKGR